MARFTNGWVKIHRSLLEERWDGPIRSILIHLIMIANYEDGKPYMRRGKLIVVKRGQLITSLTELSLKLELNRKTIRRYIEILTNMGTITSKMDNKGCIITICNYNKYQDTGTAEWSAEGTPDWSAEGTRIEEVKKLRIKERLSADADKSSLTEFLKIYEDLVRMRYRMNPIKSARNVAIAKRVLATCGFEKASLYLEKYFAIDNDPLFYAAKHDLSTFELRLHAISVHAETGLKYMTFDEAQKVHKGHLKLT